MSAATMSAATGRLFSSGESGHPRGYHSPDSIAFLRDATAQLDEGCVPGLALSDMNTDIPCHYQASPTGLPTSNQCQSVTVSPTQISPVMHPLAPGPGPSVLSVLSARVPQRTVQFIASNHRHECGICPKSFDRPCRMENCRNRHLGAKPHQCRGRCGTSGWYVLRKIQLPFVLAFLTSDC
jgi:hypothetical protein